MNALRNGEELGSLIIEEARIHGISLEPRIIKLDKAPLLAVAKNYEGQLSFTIDNLLLAIQQKISKEHAREAVSYLCGHGYCGPPINRLDSLYKGVTETEIKYLLTLAMEIWDANIHKIFIQEKIPGHNNTKDFQFCQDMARRNYKEGVARHRKLSNMGVAGDTPHHMNLELFAELVEREIEEPIIEVMYDQASFSSRWFKKTERLSMPQTELQKEYLQGGMCFIREGEKEYEWIYPSSILGFNTKFQSNLWDTWKKVNEIFAEYWRKTFGEYNENWTPPVVKDQAEQLLKP